VQGNPGFFIQCFAKKKSGYAADLQWRNCFNKSIACKIKAVIVLGAGIWAWAI